MKKKLNIGDQQFEIDLKDLKSDNVEFELDGKTFSFSKEGFADSKLTLRDSKDKIISAIVTGDSQKKWINIDKESTSVATASSATQLADAGDSFKSPMPGTIFKIFVSEGEKVEKGQTLLILEAMKMEHPVKAPADSVVEKLYFKEGDKVEGGVELLRLEQE